MQAITESKHFYHNIETVWIESIAVNVLRDSDISIGIESGQEIKTLEDKTNFVAAEFGALAIRHFRQVISVHQDLTTCSAR